MAGSLPGDASQDGTYGFQRHPDMSEEDPGWYFTRKEIEENSPSKRDGIDWKKETYLRKSYCTFLQDLGMRLKVPQVTIATAIIFCHRFFLRHSLGRNDRRIIATACMFLAGKAEETPRPLKDIILVSYEITNKKDPVAAQRIKQREVYEQQKELVLYGERLVLQTLGFDLNLHHPYKPLVEAIKKFKVAQNALAQVAWNFVNDGLRTCLCLQFQPHHIAAGAIFLAAKFIKVKLPSDGDKVWWQEFDVTPRQLEEVSNQMLELYEQNRVPPSNDIEGATGGGATSRSAAKVPASNDENDTSSRLETPRPEASKTVFESSATNLVASNDGRRSDYGGTDMKQRAEDEAKGDHHLDGETLPHKENLQEAQDMVKSQSGYREEQESNVGRSEMKEAIKKIDRDKVKAALEKRRKASGHMIKKIEVMNEDDLIERELEDGIELAAQSEKNKQDRKQNWFKPSDNGNMLHHEGIKSLSQPSSEADLSTVEEGKASAVDDIGHGLESPKSSNRKRKAASSPDRVMEGKTRHPHNRFEYMEDRNKVGRLGHSERDSKRHLQENHV